MSMIFVNGERTELPPGTIWDLLNRRGIDPAGRGVAIALNGAVVPCARWPETEFGEGDRIDIVRAFAGG
jgi:sulfur carrier protein